MFYSTQILSRKGALGTIWIASHLEKRLKRNQIFETSIPASVDSVLNSEAPLALRLSGQLLLGIVRVYLRKLQYLQQDAEHAVEGLIKGTGRGGAGVDLPDGGTAPEMAITLPDLDPMALFASAAGADLFPSFESDLLSLGAGGGGRGLFDGGSHSLTAAQDISELFGSKWSGPADDERFDVPEQIDRRFSIELERLRSAAAAEAAKPGEGLFFEPPPGEAYDAAPALEDEMMAPPPDELFAVQPTAELGPTPGSVRRGRSLSAGAPLPGLSAMQITPPSLGGPDLMLPELGGGATGFSSPGASLRSGRGGEIGAGAAGEPQAPPPSALRRAPRPRQPRRRPPTVDVDESGNPAMELPAKEIRALLLDRKPLLARRGLSSQHAPAALPPQHFDVAAQLQGQGGDAVRPSSFAVLAPELLALFHRSAPAIAAAGATNASAGRRRSQAALEGPEAGDAERAGEGASCGPWASGLDASGAEQEPDFPTAGQTGLEADYIEDSQRQDKQEQHEALATSLEQPFDAAVEGCHSPLSAARRTSLALQPSSSSVPELGSLAAEADMSEGSGLPADARDAFTARTRMALAHLQSRFQPTTGSKRRHPSQGDLAVSEISLDELVEGKSRLDACRWFFEALVLNSRGYVHMQQEEPYGSIALLPRPKLLTAVPAAAQ